MGELLKLNHNDGANIVRRVHVCPELTDVTSNASYVLGYTGDNLTTITKTVDDGEGGSVSYVRTLSYTGG